MSRPLAACCLALLAAATASAQGPEPVRLTLRPAAPSSPVLRYRLLPELIGQRPGNAAELYQKAAPLLQMLSADEDTQIQEWEKLPLEQLPCDEVRKLLAQYKEGMGLIEQGARREYCDWGLAERLRKSGIGALLPDVQAMRAAIRLLALRARVEIAEGKFEAAVRTLRTGLALARHVGESATLISALVGNALAAVMQGQVELLVQRPGAPNLYWPLTDLPRPFLDLRRPLEGERIMAYGTFPGIAEVLGDLSAGPLSEKKLAVFSKTFFALRNSSPLQNKATIALRIRNKHEAAKRALIAAGRPRELVEKMPHVQVALLHSFADYDRHLQDAVKWQTFPYAEALPHLRRLTTRGTAGLKRTEDSPVFDLATYLMPAVEKVFAARMRIDRKFAALRCVEAIRLYAAAHDGKLPPTLADIKEVPVPADPMTGKPFQYHVSADGKATLYGPPPDDDRRSAVHTLTYELTLKR